MKSRVPGAFDSLEKCFLGGLDGILALSGCLRILILVFLLISVPSSIYAFEDPVTHAPYVSYISYTPLNPNSYSSRFHPIEFFGDYSSDFPLRATLAGDPFSIDFYEDVDQAAGIYLMNHAMGMKNILYRAFSSLSENMEFMDYWNLSKEDVSPMDLNGTYWTSLPYNPYTIGYEGRDAWRNFFIKFMKILFDAGVDGVEFDGGEGCYDFGSFDPETMRKFNQYLASKYTPEELSERFGISDINSFDFGQYLRDLGYHKYSCEAGGTIIANPCDAPAKDPDPHVRALWEEWDNFKRLMLLELYKLLWGNVTQWEKETGREFYISTRVGLPGWFVDLPFLQYVDGVNWEYCWFSAAAFGDRPDIIGYPNRTASTDFRILQSLGKRFNPWITPASSRDQTGFSEWFSYGWNMTKDPEEQYIALAEIIVCGGLPPVKWGDEGQAVNATHWKQFTRLVQLNPQLFNQAQFGEIALIYPAATAMNWHKLNFSSPFLWDDSPSYYGYEGTYYLLADSHRAFDIIVFGDNQWFNLTQPLSKLLKYKAVVLPMALCLTDDQIELLEQYLENGGIIIALGDVGIYNERMEPVDRDFSDYFDGKVHQVGEGLIISIKDISPIEYLGYRTRQDPTTLSILEHFKEIVDAYVPREVSADLNSRVHIYRFFNEDENALIFHLINFNYDFEKDKVIRAYNASFNFTLPPQLQDKEVSVWLYSEDFPEGIEVPHTKSGEVVSITIPKVSILTSIEVRPHFEVPEPQVVDEPTEMRDDVYVLNRSLIVKSSLSIVNSKIEIRGGVKPIKIEVLPGGSLKIINSTIYKTEGNYYIIAREGSSIFINGSDISGAGLFGPLERGGICIETEGAVIANSKIHDNYEYGLLLFNANHSVIVNSEFYGNTLAISILDSSFVQLDNNTVRDNYVGVLVRSSGVEMGITEIVRMYERGILPPRGAVKQIISNSHIVNNQLVNVILSGTNFASIENSECSNASVMNILIYRSIARVFNCSIHSSLVGTFVYESPIITFIGNRVYNNSHIGLKLYKCCSMGILHWLHLEPIAAYSDEGDIRVIGNYFENNGYGIHIDFEGGPTGYFNRHVRISENAFTHNSVGIFVNRAVGEIIRNNFIDNNKHVESNGYEPLPAFSIDSPESVGNYWDTYKGDGPYEVLLGYYDYHPLMQPIWVPTITDHEGPLVNVENCKVLEFNETHVAITFDLHTSDEQSYLGDVYLRTHFGFVGLLSPNMQDREFGWIGFTSGILGPEFPTKSHTIHNFTFVYGWTAEMEPVPLPKKWISDATLTIYVTDRWGNWNKNDTVEPYIKIVTRVPEKVHESDSVTLYILVSDWSEISDVQVKYFDGSTWHTTNVNFDRTTHLYYATIPAQTAGTTVKYSVFAEDILGNGGTYTNVYTVLSGYAPERPSAVGAISEYISKYPSISSTFMILVIVILITIGVVIFVVRKRKRRR